MIVLIDNYDSFTYNLYQYISRLEKDVKVIRNDAISINDLKKLNPSKIIISPGPKDPDSAGISLNVIENFYDKVPILGVCLGHQCICQYFGGKIIRANEILHGKTSLVTHNCKDIFKGLKNPLTVARYHSLILDPRTLPDDLEITSTTENNEIMAVKHKNFPIFGLQFHPESFLTEDGFTIIKNFIEL